MNYEDIIKELLISNIKGFDADEVAIFKIAFKDKKFVAAIPLDEYDNDRERLEAAASILFAKICPDHFLVQKSEKSKIDNKPIYKDDCDEIDDAALFENFKEKQSAGREKLLSQSVIDIKEFTTRLQTILWKNEILYVRDLADRTEEDFMAIHRLGKDMVKQIKSFLTKNGFRMKR